MPLFVNQLSQLKQNKLIAFKVYTAKNQLQRAPKQTKQLYFQLCFLKRLCTREIIDYPPMDPCGHLAPNYLGNLPLPRSYLFPASWLARGDIPNMEKVFLFSIPRCQPGYIIGL